MLHSASSKRSSRGTHGFTVAVCLAGPGRAARAGSLRVSCRLAPAQTLQAIATFDPSRPLLQYSLPPDKLEKAYALYLLNGTLYFVTTAWGFLVLYLMLRTKFGVRLRNLATTVSRFRVVQAAMVMFVFVLVLELTHSTVTSTTSV